MSTQRLVMVWSSADPEVARNMVFMYSRAAQKNGWFDDVTLIVWGPSSRLLTEDETLRSEFLELANGGVKLMACRKCAENLGVQEQLVNMGVESIYIGETLSSFIKEGRHVLTF